MKRALLVPDSFKGTMSSAAVCSIMKEHILKHYPDADSAAIPAADRGEGSVDAFLYASGGVKKSLEVKGPFFNDINAFYGLIHDGHTAVIEMAACAGLLLAGDTPCSCRATTYGVGELIAAALNDGCSKIIIGLGGSYTNDGGGGIAAALGVRFYDRGGMEFVPTGGTLEDIAHIDLSGLDTRLGRTEFVGMCDVNNPLYGESGAAYVFGSQKGASPETVRLLDRGLRGFADSVKACLGIDAADMAGAGAAGGLGYGMKVFFNAQLQMGIDAMLDAVNFDLLARGAGCVFTGEGRLDAQSLHGKVVAGVARRSRSAGVPVIAVAGDIGDNIDGIYEEGVSAVFSINRIAADYEHIRRRASSDLSLTMDNIIRCMRILHG